MANQTVTVARLERTAEMGSMESSQPTPQTITVSSLRRGATMGAPRIRQGGVTPAPIELKLYGPDFSTFKSDLPDTWARRFQEQINDPGSGSFSIDNWVDNLGELELNDITAAIEEDDIVRFYVNGECAFAMVVTDIKTQSISQDEESGEETNVDGVGVLSVLSDGVVYPSRGVGVWPIEEDRVFNWTSVDFDDSGWGAAASMMSVGDAQTLWPTLPFGEGFIDTSAAVLWAPGTTSYNAPEGHCYFRKVFTAARTCRALFYGTIDNYGEVYLDGQSIMEVTAESGFQGVVTFALDITAGPHTLAVHGGNFPDDADPGYNPGGVALVLWEVDEADQPLGSGFIVHTDTTWLCLPYPPGPPGMTPGEVMIHCCNEAILRGCFPALTFAFDEHVDSNGNPWDTFGDISTKVGTDIMTFFGEMSETYMDFWMEPSRLRLWAWRKGERGSVISGGPTYGDANASLVNLSHEVSR